MMNRRDFGRSLAAAGAVLAGWKRLSANEGAATVVMASSMQVRNAQRRVQGDQVLRLLDKAIEKYFQLLPAAAWKKVVTRSDVVGLKVNALAGPGLSTHRELIEAICERLQQAGVAAENIIIWDRLNRDLERAGYSVRLDGKGPRCYGNDVAGYTDHIYEFGNAASRLSRIVTDRCSVLINVPVLKDHGIVGVSAGMKNFFGAIDNPNKYHDAVGDPYVADVNMLAPIRDKLRLIICDALTAQYEGGPPFMEQWSWPLNSLLLSTDMVALDRIGWEVVENKRKEVGRPSLKQAGREPRYILTAGDASHQLGVADRTRIHLQRCE
jgi:uncharacterized protein (DUF362 family)